MGVAYHSFSINSIDIMEETSKMSKYIGIHLVEKKPKTNVYAVYSKKDNSPLGFIKWYSAWRQYYFFPLNDTVWNNDCLNTINSYIRKLNFEHKMRT